MAFFGNSEYGAFKLKLKLKLKLKHSPQARNFEDTCYGNSIYLHHVLSTDH